MKALKALLMIFVCSSLLLSLGCNTVEDEPTGPDENLNPEGYKEVTSNNITLQWKAEGELLRVKVSAPTTGWVGIGFDPSPGQKMLNANFIIGYVSNGTVNIRDDWGSGLTSHGPDVDSGGEDNVTEKSGTEAEGKTEISFTIPLNSGDSKDRPLSVGNSYGVILAYGQDGADNFAGFHKETTFVNIEV